MNIQMLDSVDPDKTAQRTAHFEILVMARTIPAVHKNALQHSWKVECASSGIERLMTLIVIRIGTPGTDSVCLLSRTKMREGTPLDVR